MTEVDWTTESAIRLIEEYKKHPELWDVSHELYRVQTAKYEAWTDIARVFRCDIADLRKKLNSIFASHRREKTKIRSGGRSTWFLYPYMRFLPNHLDDGKQPPVEIVVTQTKNETTASLDESDESDDDDNEDVEQEMQRIIKEEPVTDTFIENPPSRDNRKTIKRKIINNRSRMVRPLLKRKIVPVTTSNSNTTNNTNNHNNLDSRLLETLKLLRKSDLSRKKDECDSFGEYIATSLRKHDERTQSMIKQAINNILFEQEMKKYTAGQYTVVISGVDENPLVLSDEK